jgi:hypothetical protein
MSDDRLIEQLRRSNRELIRLLHCLIRHDCIENMSEEFQDDVDIAIAQAEKL